MNKISVFWLIIIIGFLSPISVASPVKITLPVETIKLRPSKLPGFSLAMQKCTLCHSSDYIDLQPPGMSQGAWTNQVLKMRSAFSAPLNDAEISQIGAYLAVAYGNASENDPSIKLASENAIIDSNVGGLNSKNALDIPTLLTVNACVGCHANNAPLIGPSFKSISNRYKNDPIAGEKLMKSIRSGAVGRWGNQPMPPMNTLTDGQIMALIQYVLAQ